MNRLLTTASLLAMFALPTSTLAQSDQETIDRALHGLPERDRADAMVVSWNADHSWNTLKEGTNGWVCYDRSGEGNRPAFAVQCTHVANLERIAQNRRFASEGGDRAGVRALVEAAAADGTRVPAEFGSVWFATNGPDLASARTHVTVSVPGATSESLGLPSGRSPGMVTIMQGGTTEAHLMVPSR